MSLSIRYDKILKKLRIAAFRSTEWVSIIVRSSKTPFDRAFVEPVEVLRVKFTTPIIDGTSKDFCYDSIANLPISLPQ
ncbi:MAG: hypothetical protein H7Y13_13420 [Sphingobacteriaceae bacterium]|nr:hypothetical protein [Sphingobacteriaceae bacterium]